MWFLSIFLVISSGSALASPASQQDTQELLETSQFKTKAKQMVRAQVEAMTLTSVGKESRAALALDSSDFKDLLNRNIKSSNSSEKKLEIVREISTGQTAQSVLSQWLGMKSLADHYKADDRLSLGWFTDQVSVSSSNAGIQPVSKWTRVESDVGLQGNQNGRIERGEWILVNVVVATTANQPYFSTSSFVRSASQGILLPTHGKELVWSETNPDEETQLSYHATSFWAYVSPEAGIYGSVQIEVRDSWQNKGNRSTLTVSIKPDPYNLMGVRVSPRRVDRDEPGFSEVSSKPLPAHGEKFEVVMDVTGGGYAKTAHQFAGASSHQQSVIGTHVYGEHENMVRSPYGWAAGNDLDVRLLTSKSSYDRALQRLESESEFHTPTKHTLWFGSVVELEATSPSKSWQLSESTLKAIAEKRKALECSPSMAEKKLSAMAKVAKTSEEQAGLREARSAWAKERFLACATAKVDTTVFEALKAPAVRHVFYHYTGIPITGPPRPRAEPPKPKPVDIPVVVEKAPPKKYLDFSVAYQSAQAMTCASTDCSIRLPNTASSVWAGGRFSVGSTVRYVGDFAVRLPSPLVTTTTELGTLEKTNPFVAQVNPLGVGFGQGGEATDVQAHVILGTTIFNSDVLLRRGVLNWQIGATARFGHTTHFVIDLGLRSQEEWDNLTLTGPELTLGSFRGGVGIGTSW